TWLARRCHPRPDSAPRCRPEDNPRKPRGSPGRAVFGIVYAVCPLGRAVLAAPGWAPGPDTTPIAAFRIACISRPCGGHMTRAGLRDEVAAIHDELTDLRRSIHAEPEIGLDLPATQRKVVDALHGLPVEVTLGRELSSVTAVLRGGLPGPAVL